MAFKTDIVAALPAGTNAIGKLAANSGVDIGDVDVPALAPKAPAGNGEVQGNAAATQCPNVACTQGVKIKAAYDNAGRIYFGLTGVTKKDGTTDTTTGYEMNAGDSEFFPVSNLNQLYYICDNAGDDFTYIAF